MSGRYDAAMGITDLQQPEAPALMPRVARLSDGLIHQSQATLYAARAADWTQAGGVLRVLADRLGVGLPAGF